MNRPPGAVIRDSSAAAKPSDPGVSLPRSTGRAVEGSIVTAPPAARAIAALIVKSSARIVIPAKGVAAPTGLLKVTASLPASRTRFEPPSTAPSNTIPLLNA